MQTSSNPVNPSENPVSRVRHDLVRRELHVSRIDRPSPGFVALTLTGPSLASFVSLSHDDHVKLFLTDGEGQTIRRDYTPRHYDTEGQTLTIEFALHERGMMAQWADKAQVGDALTIGGPRGSMMVRNDLDWYLLCGDATALPAVARRLEELPAGTPVTALIRVDRPEDQRALASAADLRVQWLTEDAAWLQALREWAPPAGTGFVWCAGEAAVMGQARDIVLQQHGIPRSHTRISAYWKRGASDFHDDLT